MNIHQLDIVGGYSGTVEVSEGDIRIAFPTASFKNKLKLYNIHLLCPDKANIEFNLLRSLDGEWCDDYNLQLPVPGSNISSGLRKTAKQAIVKMGI